MLGKKGDFGIMQVMMPLWGHGPFAPPKSAYTLQLITSNQAYAITLKINTIKMCRLSPPTELRNLSP